MARWIAALGLCALAFGAAPGDAVAGKTNRYLKKAQKAYENLDYTRVTPLLNRALKAANDDGEKVEIYYLLGVMHTIYSRDEQAAEAFVEVLKLDQSFELPPDTSPKIRTAFAAAKEQIGPVAAAPEGEQAPDGTETVDAASVDEGEQLPDGVFGPTDEAMPGLSSRRSRGSWYTKWWVWTIVGVAVAGGASVLAYSLTRVEYPDSDFGPVPLQ